MKRIIRSSLAVLVLGAFAACSTQDADRLADAGNSVVPDDGSVYLARGNEPGWQIELTSNSVSVVSDYGERRLSGDKPEPEFRDGIEYYSATLDGTPTAIGIFPEPCADDMSGMPYPHTVELTLGDQILRGCGGDPASLLHGDWMVTELDGAPVIEDANPTISFTADGRISGSSSCNSYTGTYMLSGEGLHVLEPASTGRSCEEALMTQEQEFLNRLSATQSFDVQYDGSILIHVGDQRTIKAVRHVEEVPETDIQPEEIQPEEVQPEEVQSEEVQSGETQPE